MLLVTEREIRRGTVQDNRNNVIGIVRNFASPSIETTLDAKFLGRTPTLFRLTTEGETCLDSQANERATNSIKELKAYCEKVTPTKQFRKFLVPWVNADCIMSPTGSNLSLFTP